MISSIHFDPSQLFWGLVGDRLLSQSLTSSPNCLRLPRASRASGTRGFPAQGRAQTQSWGVPNPPRHSPHPQGLQTVPCPTPWRSSSVSGSYSCSGQVSRQWEHPLRQHCRAWPGSLTPQKFRLKFHFHTCRGFPLPLQALSETDEISATLLQHQVPSPCSLPGTGRSFAWLFSSSAGKNPRSGLSSFGQSWDLASPRRGWASCVRAQSTPMFPVGVPDLGSKPGERCPCSSPRAPAEYSCSFQPL